MAKSTNPRVDEERNRRLTDHLARDRADFLALVARVAGARGDVVEDVVQSALLDVLRSFPGPDDRRAVAAYAARCVQHQVAKTRRRFDRKESHNAPMPDLRLKDTTETRIEVGLADGDAPDPADAALAREGASELLELVLELPLDQRAVLLLSAAGYGPSESAQILGLSERQVRKRIEKANRELTRLRDER